VRDSSWCIGIGNKMSLEFALKYIRKNITKYWYSLKLGHEYMGRISLFCISENSCYKIFFLKQLHAGSESCAQLKYQAVSF
jgi:hypothetical protein